MTEALKLERDARGKRPQFFDAPALDHMMSMIMVLAEEMNVLADRLDTVERIAATKGLVLEDEIEAFAPDEGVLAAREERRQAFLQRLYYLMRKEAADLSRKDTGARYEETLEEIAEQ
ncbi:MAG: hypothetical protein AAGL49_12640 [Pseudomonadota bacterium]